MIRKLSSFTDSFHYVTYGIFALWLSLNQMFVIKFSVSFDTDQSRKNQAIACCNRGLRLTKHVKRATRHLSPPATHVA